MTCERCARDGERKEGRRERAGNGAAAGGALLCAARWEGELALRKPRVGRQPEAGHGLRISILNINRSNGKKLEEF